MENIIFRPFLIKSGNMLKIVLLWCRPHPPLSIFGSDLRKFKEAKKQFDKVSEEKEAALIKNAQAPRNKQHEVEEATSILTATRKCFRHIVLDYVLQVGHACGDWHGCYTYHK